MGKSTTAMRQTRRVVATAEPVVDVAVELASPPEPGLTGSVEQAGLRLLQLLSDDDPLDLRRRGPPSMVDEMPLELSILLTDDAGIRELNRTWREIDAATDVLSFPLGEGAVLGDVVISVETAHRRVGADWDLDDELVFLLIHGLLHLLGHDHEVDEERAIMEAGEQRLWTALGRTGTLRATELDLP